MRPKAQRYEQPGLCLFTPHKPGLRLEDAELRRVLSALPSIDVDLDGDCGNEIGQYRDEQREIQFGKWLISCDLSVSAIGKSTRATYYEPLGFD